jgi:methionyl-tRNA synthetase
MPSGTRCSAIYPISKVRKTPDVEAARTIHCQTCGHDVQPQATHTASMLGGTVVTIERCPGCKAVLESDR